VFSRLDEIETLFDAVQPKFDSVQAARQGRALLFEDPEARLQLPIVVTQRVHLFAQSAQVDEDDVFRLRRHFQLSHSTVQYGSA
jgi:hypothetical protein